MQGFKGRCKALKALQGSKTLRGSKGVVKAFKGVAKLQRRYEALEGVARLQKRCKARKALQGFKGVSRL